MTKLSFYWSFYCLFLAAIISLEDDNLVNNQEQDCHYNFAEKTKTTQSWAKPRLTEGETPPELLNSEPWANRNWNWKRKTDDSWQLTQSSMEHPHLSERNLSKMKVKLDWKLKKNRKCFNFAELPIFSQFQFRLAGCDNWLAGAVIECLLFRLSAHKIHRITL